MRRLWPLLFLVLLLLPGLPPLLRAGLVYGAERAGFRLEVGRVRGYALFGLELRDLHLQGPGLDLKAGRLRLDYQLLGLLGGRLPLRVALSDAELALDWRTLFPEGGGGGAAPPVRPVLTGLELERVRVRLGEEATWHLPALSATVAGRGPYRIRARLPGGEVAGELRLEGVPELRFEAPLTALRYWYPEIEGGTLRGRVRFRSEGAVGEGEVREGRLRVVGFPISGVGGKLRLYADRLEADLKGLGLEGPVTARATVSWKEERYRFSVEAEPTWRALARHFGAALPLEGRGELRLAGEGWEALKLSGQFSGTPRLLGYALPTRGELRYDGVFRLSAESRGRFYDREVALRFGLVGQDWRLSYRDAKGGNFTLEGRGPSARGAGALPLPEPLQGSARVEAEIEGDRWRTRVEAGEVRLLGFKPFSLSGTLEGEGEWVTGRLGPVSVSGRWSDLQLRLMPLPMAVGTLRGELSYRGRFSGRLDYRSPYTSFPIQVEEEGGRWRFLAPYGEGRYADGVFTLTLASLPVRLGEVALISGRAVYREGGWDGAFEARAPHLFARAALAGRRAEIRAELRGPYGVLPLSGAYEDGALWLLGEGFALGYREGRVYYQGQLRYGPLVLDGALAYDGRFYGEAAFRTGTVEGRVFAREGALWLRSQGLLRLSGRLWPDPELVGRFAGMRAGPLRVPELPVSLRGSVFRAGVSVLDFGARRLAIDLPLSLWGEPGRLVARGSFEAGQATLVFPGAGTRIEAVGPWRALRLTGGIQPLGLSLTGRLDAFALSYRAEARFKKVEGALALSGQGRRFRLSGRLVSGGALALSAVPGDFHLRAEGFSLAPFGLPLRLAGEAGYRGAPFAELVLALGNYRARLSGDGEVTLALEGPGLAGKGTLGARAGEVRLSLAHPWLAGALRLGYGSKGLWGRGEGTLRLPGTRPAPWRFTLEGTRWQLDGALRVKGEGARYRGSFTLETLLGAFSGALEGEGIRAGLTGKLALPRGEAWVRARVAGHDYTVTLALPGGEVRAHPGRIEVPGLDLAALGKALGLALSGRVAGRLGDGTGVVGTLGLWGKEVRFSLRRGRGLVWLPGFEAGLWLSFRDGVVLEGLGALSGRIALKEGRLLGRLRLKRPVQAELLLAGSPAAPRWRLSAQGDGYSLAVAGEGLAYRGQFRLDGPYASGRLELSGKGLRYRGKGRLATRYLLLQTGPVRLSGEGARVEAVWEAPLRVAYRSGRLSLEGEGALAGGGRLLGRLFYRPEKGFSGAMTLEAGPLRGKLSGVGALFAELSYPGGGARLRLEPDFSLHGQGVLERGLLQSTLSLRYRLGGSLFDPRLEGEGRLLGRGAELALVFGYRRGAWARISGPGVSVRLEGRFLEAELDALNLGPFLGLPLTLSARGAGALGEVSLPLRLAGPGLSLAGTLDPARFRLALSGTVYGGRAALAADPEEARLTLAIPKPRIEGTLTWRRGEGTGGALALTLPLPGGALSGRLVGEDLRLVLAGEGAAGGTLTLWIRERRAEGRLWYRAGGAGTVVLDAQGPRIALRGEDGLSPLSGTLDLAAPLLRWAYRGPLPGGVARLEAKGRFPGRWLQGRLLFAGKELALAGDGTRLLARGEGLRLALGPSELSLKLRDFVLGPLSLSGDLSGAPRAFSGRVSWRAGKAGGEAQIRYDGALALEFSGDVAGALRLGPGGWSGALSGGWGRLVLRPRFRAEGTLLEKPFSLDLEAKRVRFGGLLLTYPWRFSGAERIGGVTLRGEGAALAAYAFGFRLGLRPNERTLVLTHVRGQGALVYREGRVEGRLALDGRVLEGKGREVSLSGTTPAIPALPLPAGRVEGRLTLAGAWELAWRAGAFRLKGEGRGLAGRLFWESPYGRGEVRLEGGVSGALALRDLPFFGFTLDLDFQGPELDFVLKSPSGTVEGFARFDGFRLAEAGARALALDLAALPALKAKLPYLVGRVGGVWRYQGGEGLLQVGSAALGIKGAAYPFALTLRHGRGVTGELVWAGLRARFEWVDRLRFSGEARDFPLELPAALLVGPIEGSVRVTGRFAGGGPEPWLELAFERVRVLAGKGQMVGELALRYREGTLELLRLALDGDGRMHGAGRWTFGTGGDFWLTVENADFTPLLRLDPRLARYLPTGRGDLAVEGQGQRLRVRGQGAFALAGIAGRVEDLTLDYDAGPGTFSLALSGAVEKPVESRFRLEGGGRPGAFSLSAQGDLVAPLLAPIAGIEARFSYPAMTLTAQAGAARLSGRVWPTDLTLTGRLPLAYPRYYLTSGEAEVALRLRLEKDGLYHLSGDAGILRALLALPKKRPVVEERRKRTLPLAFDQVRIHADGGVVLNEPLAQGELGGEVYLGGTAGDPYLVGEVRALRGSFLLLNHRFEVEEGWARFSPELGIYPRLFLRARAETPEGPILLFAKGHFERKGERAELVLETCLSDLAVETLEACKLLPQEGAAARLLGLGEGELAQQVLELAVKNLLIGQLESELAKSLGLDLFRFETGAFEGEGIASTRFTLGKYVSPEFFLAYRYDFAEGSRIYARYQRDGLSVTFATDLSPEPSPEFSLGYAFTDALAAYLRLAEDRFELGLEWRP